MCLFSTFLAAVNIKGVFNTSNETKYEKEAPESNCFILIFQFFLYQVHLVLMINSIKLTFSLSGSSIDFNFYKTFWSLQVGGQE